MAQTEQMMHMMQPAYDQMRSFARPMVETNRLAVIKLEEMVSLQFGALHSYVGLGMDRLKAATDIRSVEDLQDFYKGQMEAAGTLQDMMLNHVRILTEMTAGMQSDFTQRLQETNLELNDKSTAIARENTDTVMASTGRMADKMASEIQETTDKVAQETNETTDKAAKETKQTTGKAAQATGDIADKAAKETTGGDSHNEPTKNELYDRARALNIEGRSSMDKDELQRAVEEAQSQQLENLTRDELYQQAQELDIEGRSSMDRKQLIEALRKS